MKARLYAILEVIFIALFCYALFNLGKIAWEYKVGKDIYDDSEQYVEVKAEDDDYIIDVNLEELQAINKDVVGWITIPDTNVDFPVLKGETNNYYLHRTYNLTESDYGSIFLDAYGKDDDFNTFIYGHNMQNGEMFGGLKKYQDEEYLENHKYVYLVLNNKETKYEVVKAYITLTTDPIYHDFNYKPDYVKDAKKIITLSTCTSRAVSERFVVIAKEVKVVWQK